MDDDIPMPLDFSDLATGPLSHFGCCEPCKKKDEEIARLKREHERDELNFKALKRKIIATDQMLRQYRAKSLECEAANKQIEEWVRKYEKNQREMTVMEAQLMNTLEEMEPIKKAKKELEELLKKKDEQIETLQIKLDSAESLNTQYEVRLASAEMSHREISDSSDSKKIASLEQSKKKLLIKLQKVKDENKQVKLESTKCKRQVRRLEKHNKRMEGELAKYLQMLADNGLVQARQVKRVLSMAKRLDKKLDSEGDSASDSDLDFASDLDTEMEDVLASNDPEGEPVKPSNSETSGGKKSVSGEQNEQGTLTSSDIPSSGKRELVCNGLTAKPQPLFQRPVRRGRGGKVSAGLSDRELLSEIDTMFGTLLPMHSPLPISPAPMSEEEDAQEAEDFSTVVLSPPAHFKDDDEDGASAGSPLREDEAPTAAEGLLSDRKDLCERKIPSVVISQDGTSKDTKTGTENLDTVVNFSYKASNSNISITVQTDKSSVEKLGASVLPCKPSRSLRSSDSSQNTLPASLAKSPAKQPAQQPVESTSELSPTCRLTRRMSARQDNPTSKPADSDREETVETLVDERVRSGDGRADGDDGVEKGQRMGKMTKLCQEKEGERKVEEAGNSDQFDVSLSQPVHSHGLAQSDIEPKDQCPPDSSEEVGRDSSCIPSEPSSSIPQRITRQASQTSVASACEKALCDIKTVEGTGEKDSAKEKEMDERTDSVSVFVSPQRITRQMSAKFASLEPSAVVAGEKSGMASKCAVSGETKTEVPDIESPFSTPTRRVTQQSAAAEVTSDSEAVKSTRKRTTSEDHANPAVTSLTENSSENVMCNGKKDSPVKLGNSKQKAAKIFASESENEAEMLAETKDDGGWDDFLYSPSPVKNSPFHLTPRPRSRNVSEKENERPAAPSPAKRQICFNQHGAVSSPGSVELSRKDSVPDAENVLGDVSDLEDEVKETNTAKVQQSPRRITRQMSARLSMSEKESDSQKAGGRLTSSKQETRKKESDSCLAKPHKEDAPGTSSTVKRRSSISLSSSSDSELSSDSSLSPLEDKGKKPTPVCKRMTRRSQNLSSAVAEQKREPSSSAKRKQVSQSSFPSRRGRGRARNVVNGHLEEMSPQEKLSVPKRGRGRPRKVPPREVQNVFLADESSRDSPLIRSPIHKRKPPLIEESDSELSADEDVQLDNVNCKTSLPEVYSLSSDSDRNRLTKNAFLNTNGKKQECAITEENQQEPAVTRGNKQGLSENENKKTQGKTNLGQNLSENESMSDDEASPSTSLTDFSTVEKIRSSDERVSSSASERFVPVGSVVMVKPGSVIDAVSQNSGRLKDELPCQDASPSDYTTGKMPSHNGHSSKVDGPHSRYTAEGNVSSSVHEKDQSHNDATENLADGVESDALHITENEKLDVETECNNMEPECAQGSSNEREMKRNLGSSSAVRGESSSSVDKVSDSLGSRGLKPCGELCVSEIEEDSWKEDSHVAPSIVRPKARFPSSASAPSLDELHQTEDICPAKRTDRVRSMTDVTHSTVEASIDGTNSGMNSMPQQTQLDLSKLSQAAEKESCMSLPTENCVSKEKPPLDTSDAGYSEEERHQQKSPILSSSDGKHTTSVEELSENNLQTEAMSSDTTDGCRDDQSAFSEVQSCSNWHCVNQFSSATFQAADENGCTQCDKQKGTMHNSAERPSKVVEHETKHQTVFKDTNDQLLTSCEKEHHKGTVENDTNPAVEMDSGEHSVTQKVQINSAERLPSSENCAASLCQTVSEEQNNSHTLKEKSKCLSSKIPITPASPLSPSENGASTSVDHPLSPSSSSKEVATCPVSPVSTDSSATIIMYQSPRPTSAQSDPALHLEAAENIPAERPASAPNVPVDTKATCDDGEAEVLQKTSSRRRPALRLSVDPKKSVQSTAQKSANDDRHPDEKDSLSWIFDMFVELPDPIQPLSPSPPSQDSVFFPGDSLMSSVSKLEKAAAAPSLQSHKTASMQKQSSLQADSLMSPACEDSPTVVDPKNLFTGYRVITFDEGPKRKKKKKQKNRQKKGQEADLLSAKPSETASTTVTARATLTARAGVKVGGGGETANWPQCEALNPVEIAKRQLAARQQAMAARNQDSAGTKPVEQSSARPAPSSIPAKRKSTEQSCSASQPKKPHSQTAAVPSTSSDQPSCQPQKPSVTHVTNTLQVAAVVKTDTTDPRQSSEQTCVQRRPTKPRISSAAAAKGSVKISDPNSISSETKEKNMDSKSSITTEDKIESDMVKDIVVPQKRKELDDSDSVIAHKRKSRISHIQKAKSNDLDTQNSPGLSESSLGLRANAVKPSGDSLKPNEDAQLTMPNGDSLKPNAHTSLPKTGAVGPSGDAGRLNANTPSPKATALKPDGASDGNSIQEQVEELVKQFYSTPVIPVEFAVLQLKQVQPLGKCWLPVIHTVIKLLRETEEDVQTRVIETCGSAKMSAATKKKISQQNFMAQGEVRLMQLLLRLIETEPECERKQLMECLWAAIFLRESCQGHHLGKASLCRLFVGLCGSEGRVEEVRVLAYNILRCGYLGSVSFIFAVAAAWPKALVTNTAPGEVGVLTVLQHIVMTVISANPTLAKLGLCLERLCGWVPSVQESQDVLSRLIAELNLTFAAPDSASRRFELCRCIEVLCSTKEPVWVLDHFLDRHVRSAVMKWMANGPESKLKPEYLMTLFQLLGTVINTNYKFEKTKKLNGLEQFVVRQCRSLLSSENKHSHPEIEQSCAEFLMMISPFKANMLFGILSDWCKTRSSTVPKTFQDRILALGRTMKARQVILFLDAWG